MNHSLSPPSTSRHPAQTAPGALSVKNAAVVWNKLLSSAVTEVCWVFPLTHSERQRSMNIKRRRRRRRGVSDVLKSRSGGERGEAQQEAEDSPETEKYLHFRNKKRRTQHVEVLRCLTRRCDEGLRGRLMQSCLENDSFLLRLFLNIRVFPLGGDEF